MDNLDWWVLRTEKFGSREIGKGEGLFCCSCQKVVEDDGRGVLDVLGNLFCSDECRYKNFDRRKREFLK